MVLAEALIFFFFFFEFRFSRQFCVVAEECRLVEYN